MIIIEDNEKEQSNRTGKPLIKDILLVLYALLAIAVVVISIRTVLVKRRKIITERETHAVEKLTDSISFPQFEYIELKADKTKQKLKFYNPPENFVKFRVSIVLDDEVLWESELLQPGESSKPVVLTKALPEGEYEGRLVYHSFADDEEKNPLSGADSPTKLKVK